MEQFILIDKPHTISEIEVTVPTKEEHVKQIYIYATSCNNSYKYYKFVIPNVIINNEIKLYKNIIPSAVTTITISDKNVIDFLLQLDEHIKLKIHDKIKKK